ncbi:MAG: PIN domain-containing protein [Bacteroidetes bacterium]|nr:PIN domain-containing protein [Fibrella sp.]
MRYLLDTNVLVNAIRESSLYTGIVTNYGLENPGNLTIISEVTIGELYSLALQRNWGNAKRERMMRIIKRFTAQRISFESIYNTYADLDAYSQGRHPALPAPPGLTARNMGKNDLWLAATAYVSAAALLTTDGDFDHLDRFITVIKITP